jgi:hypothetical protein
MLHAQPITHRLVREIDRVVLSTEHLKSDAHIGNPATNSAGALGSPDTRI